MIESHTFTGSTRVVSGTFEITNPSTLLGEVILEFPDGTAWAYRDVPREVWERFTESGSAGQFLREELDHYQRGPA